MPTAPTPLPATNDRAPVTAWAHAVDRPLSPNSSGTSGAPGPVRAWSWRAGDPRHGAHRAERRGLAPHPRRTAQDQSSTATWSHAVRTELAPSTATEDASSSAACRREVTNSAEGDAQDGQCGQLKGVLEGPRVRSPPSLVPRTCAPYW